MIKNLFSKRNAPDMNVSNEEQGASAEVLVQQPETKPGEVVRDIAGLRVRIERFPAMDGFEFRRRALRFSDTQSRRFHRAFTIDVLSFASVIGSDGEETRLNSAAVIDATLNDWTVLDAILKAVLAWNRVDPTSAEFHLKAWRHVGSEVAETFVASLQRISTPAVEALMDAAQKQEVKA